MKHQRTFDIHLTKKCFIFSLFCYFTLFINVAFQIREATVNSLPVFKEALISREALTSNANTACPLPGEEVHIWCSCYEFDEGLFVDCPSTELESIKRTLTLISSPMKSFTIYNLDRNVTKLPNALFANASVERIQISLTSLEDISEGSFLGVETKLKSLSITNSKLKSVPQSAISVLKELQSLDFDTNDISEVESYAFYGLPLVSLNLQRNKISSLLEYSFGGLENSLEELVLINNKLVNFPLTALRRLRKLSTLKLLGNEIREISDDGFTRFTALQNLDLNSNRISQLNDRSFITMPKLVSLFLSANKLTALDEKVFVHLVDLEILDMSHNSLRTLNGDVFASLRKLRTIDLSNNHLHFLKYGTFHNLPNLRELFLSRNNLLKVSNDTFRNSSQLSALFLSHNAIREIEFGTFDNTPNLNQLHLSFNQIREIHPNLFKHLLELRSLSLDNNLIANIQPGTFQELIELTDLRLQRNLLKKVRKGVFYSFPSLQELHLQNNRIEVIETEALQSLANLEYFNIQGNKLIEIGDALSKYPSSLRHLQLNNNNIFAIHNDSFRGQNRIEILWLNYNKIQKITKDVFRDLTRVQKIYLDHNELASIDNDAFSALNNLVYLNLEYNNLNHLSVGQFRGAVSVVELYLSHNRVMDIEPFTFQSMKNLKVLHLSNNQIYVVRKYMFQGDLPVEELNLSNIMAEEIEEKSFSELSSLKNLDLSHNNFSANKIDFLNLPKVKHLNLKGNNMSVIFPDTAFERLTDVEYFDLSETRFNVTENTKCLSSLRNIETLKLQSNSIKVITKETFDFGNLRTVRKLYLDDNKLDFVPDTSVLGKMPNLEVVSLSRNLIKHVEKGCFAENRFLKKVNMSSNSLSVVDASAFVNLTSLLSIDLSNNVMRHISQGVFDGVYSLQEINLDSNWFQYIPNNLMRSALSSLKSLTVNRNPILRIREDLSIFGGFPALERLSIEQANLSIIASHDFFGFSNLNSLSLRSNHISKISPGSFRPLRALTFMDLGDNELEILPEERLTGLSMLKTLNLTANHLLEMPSFSPDLRAVEHLDVSYNRLTRVDTFGHLGQSVKSIYLHNNIIAWIANNAFQNLSSLQVLDLHNNFLSHFGEAIFAPIEVSIETLFLAGNPIHCDCKLLDIWEWLQDHSRIIPSSERDKELLCVQPEKLREHLVFSLHPVDFCPVPLISLMEVLLLSYDSVTIRWDVQNGEQFSKFVAIFTFGSCVKFVMRSRIKGRYLELQLELTLIIIDKNEVKAALNLNGANLICEDTLVGGFTLDYHLTSDRIPVVTNRRLSSLERNVFIDHLESETWYTVCVQANGKYLRALNNKPTPYVVDHQRNYGDYSTSNRKCLQVRTLAFSEKSKLALSTIGIIVAACVTVVFIITVFILITAITLRKRRRRQRPVKNDVPEEYITYRHFSLPSSETVYS
ncbi:chaoptin-like protein [Leptotrombidium deliense]|uniref:Chaoptin-like protein n=1 Tax=Leptotrombidium deliense TaxID=299467 RepID=A0A443SR74_9ACAR|nr:chaoptin-like protein [Leptotrombidium deliense]